MTMISEHPLASGRGLVASVRRVFKLGDRIPLSFVLLAGRVAGAHVFWKSAQTKLASWQVTQQLFAYEYQVPLLDPNTAATLATAAELAGAVMLAFGVFARPGALMLLGVVAVIQLFVFPGHWGEHLMWAALLGLVVARGAGTFSVDHLADRYFRRMS